MRERKMKILVAMSGGVDSSVAAALLLRQGYDVAGAFMVNYDTNDANFYTNDANYANKNVDNADCANKKFGECWRNDYRDATRVAAKLGIPLFKLDFKKDYEKKVLAYMFAEYKKGRTPNPDVLCNKFIKFGVWLQKAKELGFDKLATGHYANIKTLKHKNIKTYKLLRAKDDNKDQTYFLHQLNQKQLKDVLFPIGDYKKSEVRKIAKKFNLPTADRAESMGICFIGEVPMKDFLLKKMKIKKGNIITSDGEVVGEHDGLAFYTIGQRHLKIINLKFKMQNGDTKPLYVVDKRNETNELVVGFINDPLLYKKQAEVVGINWISGPVFAPVPASRQEATPGKLYKNGQKLTLPLECKVRLRHRQPLQAVQLVEKDDKITMQFANRQKAITPGQFAVFYLNGICLGGGVIK